MKPEDLVGDAKYYSALAARARQQYDQAYAKRYREFDCRGVNAPTHTDFGNLLTEVSMSFGRPIAVLDLGCGTGRYFHCLRNLKRLTGVDVSLDMLRQAQHPVQEPISLTVPITLLCSNIADVSLKNNAFDLIYSIGVLGEFLPFDGYLCEKVARMLTPTGQFVFTVVDQRSTRTSSWKRRVAELFLPILPKRVQRVIRVRLRSLWVSEDDLRAIMEKTPWSSYTIKPRVSSTSGRKHLICVATKE
jgi:ubiquinone/menaquinone biosynthesis C-methylase UbiE